MKKLIFFFVMITFISANAQPLEEFRGVKITNVDSDVLFTDQKIAQAMDYLAEIGINVVLPVVWNGHGTNGVYTLYPSRVMEQLFSVALYPLFPAARDPLKRVIIEAHRNGMEVMPWFEMGFSPAYSQNGGHILEKFPHWALKNSAGKLVVKNGFDWMSGINPEVQAFILSLVTEILENYDVDGIEFSDRIPAMPVEGGYDSATVAIYQSEHSGAQPPTNYLNAAWMQWRAEKLTQFYQTVRDSIKARGTHLVVSSSPSVYPWSYQEYLQDSKTWVETGIVDNIIPQIYRYNFTDYNFELNKSLGYIPAGKRDIFFAGMLIYLKGENYLISPDFLLNSIQANRQRQVQGEVFFFYEGLQVNNNLLAETLKQTVYALPARLLHRSGNIWRPKALIVNEDEAGAKITGNWEHSSIAGFQPNILIKKDADYAAVTYYFDVPFSAWFDVFAYVVTGPLVTNRAPYTVYSENDSSLIYVNHQNFYNGGWQPLETVYLTAGRRKVLKIDNRNVPAGQYVVADAAMIMINRKLSPTVKITGIESSRQTGTKPPANVLLFNNYPNPFNRSTNIQFQLIQSNRVTLKIYNSLGQAIQTLLNAALHPGIYSIGWNGTDHSGNEVAAGIYFLQLKTDEVSVTRKMILLL